MKVIKYLGFGLIIAWIGYWFWANAGRNEAIGQQLKLDAVVQYGDSTSGKNILGIQPYMTAADYASPENFAAKMNFYFAQAQQKSLLIPNRTIVVLPEYIGTWLVVAGEKKSIYSTKSLQNGLETMVMSNIFKFLKTYLESPKIIDPIKHSVFAMKAASMAAIYQQTFEALAQKYEVMIVAGSILLPNPTVENGVLRPNNGQLFNTAVVFEPGGKINPKLIKKIHPTSAEQGFVCSATANELPVFDTPMGKLGVLVCADAWFSDAYKVLQQKGATMVVVPTYSDGEGHWSKAWSGYSAAPTPDDAKADVGKITLGQAWQKHAMLNRATQEAGIQKGVNVFLQGQLWDAGTDGTTLVLDKKGHDTQLFKKAALVNLWL